MYRDGREKCQNNAAGDKLYKERTLQMAQRQENICCICKDPSDPMTAENVTFEHEDGRGAGGGRRNDAIVDKSGKWINGAAHFWCNVKKGSRRIASSN